MTLCPAAALAEDTDVEKKYKELAEYRAKLEAEGKDPRPVVSYEKTTEVMETRIKNADTNGLIAERIIQS